MQASGLEILDRSEALPAMSKAKTRKRRKLYWTSPSRRFSRSVGFLDPRRTGRNLEFPRPLLPFSRRPMGSC